MYLSFSSLDILEKLHSGLQGRVLTNHATYTERNMAHKNIETYFEQVSKHLVNSYPVQNRTPNHLT